MIPWTNEPHEPPSPEDRAILRGLALRLLITIAAIGFIVLFLPLDSVILKP